MIPPVSDCVPTHIRNVRSWTGKADEDEDDEEEFDTLVLVL